MCASGRAALGVRACKEPPLRDERESGDNARSKFCTCPPGDVTSPPMPAQCLLHAHASSARRPTRHAGRTTTDLRASDQPSRHNKRERGPTSRSGLRTCSIERSDLAPFSRAALAPHPRVANPAVCVLPRIDRHQSLELRVVATKWQRGCGGISRRGPHTCSPEAPAPSAHDVFASHPHIANLPLRTTPRVDRL